jgi:site-specific recombinase XerD
MHLANVRRFYEQWIVPGLGKEKLQKITVARLREWSAWMNDEGLSTNQRRKVINELKAMFRQAEAEGVISSDPARHLKPPKETRKPAEAVDPKYLPALLDLTIRWWRSQFASRPTPGHAAATC